MAQTFMKASVMMLIVLMVSCASGAKRLDTETDLVSDTGGITRQEMEKAAVKFAGKIGSYFKEENREDIFIAFFPTKNDTSEMIPTEFFDNRFVAALIKEGIFTVRTETRDRSLKEIRFSQSGLAANNLELGRMTSPNYFVSCKIGENMYLSGGERIVEQAIDVELVDVESQIAVWSDRVVYRKQAAERGGAGW